MSAEESRLDICLAKATNPLNEDIDCQLLNELSEAINGQTDGPQIALRFMAHKIQSPQEIEALHSLNVLEKLIQVCGHRLVDEIGKFRFLNEVIKVVSPKYLAHRSSPKVKQRIVELMFVWSLEMKEMPKIFEAYQMLKKQGIVTEDPIHILPNYKPPTPPLPRPKDEIFDDEKNAQLLQRLLKSGRSEDLEAANRLIKSMAREADKRMDRKTRFKSEIETVNNNAKVLSDMLTFYSPNDSSAEEKDLMKELFESCERLRLRLFKLANDWSDDDPNLTTLFNANDELTKVINDYRKQFGIVSNNSSADFEFNRSVYDSKQTSLLDISSPSVESHNTSNDVELLDDHLMPSSVDKENHRKYDISKSLKELGEIFTQNTTSEMTSPRNSLPNDILLPELISPSNSNGMTKVNDVKSESGPKSALEELNALSQLMIKTELSNESFKTDLKNKEHSKTSLNDLQRLQSNAKSLNKSDKNESLLSLSDINVSIDSIIPSDLKPITLYEKNDIKVILHLASNSPRIDVKVIVITIINTNHCSVFNINFLAAVPKSMRVKLQPMSGTTLQAYRPLNPPSVITQVMLIARDINKKESLRLKYKFSYKINDNFYSDVGEIDDLFDDYILIPKVI